MGRGRGASLKGTSSAIFSGLADSYERALDWATFYQDRRWKEWVVQRLRPREGGLILDVGSGTLVLEERLASSGCRFVALDLSQEMTRAGKAKEVSDTALLNGDAEALPFFEGTFDAAVSCYVPKYVDVRRLAGELARVVKPGGPVAVYDFARPRGPMAVLLDLYIQGGLRIAGLGLRLMRRKEAFTFLSLPWIVRETRWDEEIQGAMEAEGFETVEVERLTAGAVFAYCGRRKGGLG